MDPPELPVGQLVRLSGLFGISANRARVALSRMVAAGEATTDGAGTYCLSGHLRERQERQSASRSGVDDPLCRAVVVGRGRDGGQYGGDPHGPPPASVVARLAELREGVWMRPDNVTIHLPAELNADVELMVAHPADTSPPGGSPVGSPCVVGPGNGPARTRWRP